MPGEMFWPEYLELWQHSPFTNRHHELFIASDSDAWSTRLLRLLLTTSSERTQLPGVQIRRFNMSKTESQGIGT